MRASAKTMAAPARAGIRRRRCLPNGKCDFNCVTSNGMLRGPAQRSAEQFGISGILRVRTRINISCERVPIFISVPAIRLDLSARSFPRISSRFGAVGSANLKPVRSVTKPAPMLLTALRRPSPAAGRCVRDKPTPRRFAPDGAGTCNRVSASASGSSPAKPALKAQSASLSY